MPKVNRELWRSAREELDLTSEQAAARLKINGGYLRKIEGGTNEPSRRLIHRAARLYGRTYDELVAHENEGVPDEPPGQAPQGPTKPPKRAEKAGGGPKRPSGGVSRGAA